MFNTKNFKTMENLNLKNGTTLVNLKEGFEVTFKCFTTDPTQFRTQNDFQYRIADFVEKIKINFDYDLHTGLLIVGNDDEAVFLVKENITALNTLKNNGFYKGAAITVKKQHNYFIVTSIHDETTILMNYNDVANMNKYIKDNNLNIANESDFS